MLTEFSILFSTCEVLPCEDDLLKHISILRDTALRDNDVSKSKVLLQFTL